MKKDKKKFGIVKEFFEFVKKGNALALAVGVIIGSAFSAIVTSINKDIIMPLIGALIGGKDFKGIRTPLWNAKQVIDANGAVQYDEYGQVMYTSAIYWGRFIQAVIDFLLIALVLFMIMKITTTIMKKIQKAKELIIKKNQEDITSTEEHVEMIPVISDEVKILTEIRDLLVAKKDKNI